MTHLRASDWDVVPIAHSDAVAFIEGNHYAGGAPNTSVVRHALVRVEILDEILGVALWLPPTRRAAESVDRDNPRGVLALSRLCVAEEVPTNGASFLLGRSMRGIDRHRWPTLLTYADTRHGHTGGIYRATNWEHVGVMPGSDAWIDTNGVQRGRKRGCRNMSAAEMREAGFTRLAPSPKHKFVHRARSRNSNSTVSASAAAASSSATSAGSPISPPLATLSKANTAKDMASSSSMPSNLSPGADTDSLFELIEDSA